jgi:hypothetical protein
MFLQIYQKPVKSFGTRKLFIMKKIIKKKMGGTMKKKYANGGPTEPEKKASEPQPVKTEDKISDMAAGKTASDYAKMTGKEYRAEKRGIKRAQKLDRISSGKQGDRVDNVIRAVASGAEAASSTANAIKNTREAVGKMKKGGTMKKYKTGGMVNSNAKVSALKSAGSKGVKSGVNPKAAASKVARGRVGGTSAAPKTAVPKAKYGMSMRKK